MSSPSSNAGAADVGILAQNQSDSDDASSVSEGPKFTRRWDVYKNILQYGTEYCGNCCYADIADGSTTSPALPSTVGLRISGVGNVPLPISDDHGNEIKKRAPSEEEDNNGVYEIEASKIKIQNPQWDNSFKQLLTTVAYKLGVNPSKLTAELDGLTYMEKGGYIERSNDDDDDGNDNGVLGAIIIQLPSKFTGGALTIYNCEEDEEEDEDEDDEEEEKSFKFTLGAGEEAAYSCHFACHFLDCEYEMAKLWSGSRVLLRYSLHYKHDRADEIPTAGLIQYLTSPIESSLNGLPPDDRMVLIPLEREYDGLSLVNAGIKALSREHRQKAEALKAAGAEWEFLIVNAKLVHSCSDYGDDSSVTSIMEVFDERGNRVTSEMSWLKRTIDFGSIEHDEGMLLAFDDDYECVSNWGVCKARSGYYNHRQTYRSTFLVSYDPAFEMELKCLGGTEEVAEVCKKIVETRDHGLLDRLLSVVGSKRKSKFDVKSCQSLLQLLIKSRKKIASRVELVNKIIDGLSSSVEPDELLYDAIIDAVEKLGHDGLGNNIEGMLNDTKRNTGKDICFFLKMMEFALKLNKRTAGEAGLNYLEIAINNLSRKPITLRPDSTTAVSSILDMISTYNDNDLSNVVQACLNFFHRSATQQSLDTLMCRTYLLKQLLVTNKFGSLEQSLVEFAADFARGCYSCLRSKEILEGERKGVFIQATDFLVDFGTQNEWDKFGKHIIQSMNLFSVFIDAVIGVSGERLLRDVLNKCLLQYSIVDPDPRRILIPNWTVRKPNEPDILPTPSLHFQMVLELIPSVVQTKDKDERLPLHYAAASPTASYDVIMEVFKAYKQAASIRDPTTGLFPFQLAASNGNVEAAHGLLLANPNLVSSGIYIHDRKRKRSSSA